MSIGTRVIQLRNQKNLSQRRLSERSGIASSYLSRIENRHLEPQPKTLRKIAEALGVPLSELFEDGPAAQRSGRCAITASGNCIMEMLGSSQRRKGARPGIETYTPRHLHLLRMANYLIQSGSTRLLDTLDILLGALLSTAGNRREVNALVALAARRENPPRSP